MLLIFSLFFTGCDDNSHDSDSSTVELQQQEKYSYQDLIKYEGVDYERMEFTQGTEGKYYLPESKKYELDMIYNNVTDSWEDVDIKTYFDEYYQTAMDVSEQYLKRNRKDSLESVKRYKDIMSCSTIEITSDMYCVLQNENVNNKENCKYKTYYRPILEEDNTTNKYEDHYLNKLSSKLEEKNLKVTNLNEYKSFILAGDGPCVVEHEDEKYSCLSSTYANGLGTNFFYFDNYLLVVNTNFSNYLLYVEKGE